MIFLGTRVSSLTDFKQRHKHSVLFTLQACVMSFVAPADGERKRFLLLRKPSPGVSNRDWVLRVLSDPHKYALSVGSDDRTYPLRILISLSRYMPLKIRTQNLETVMLLSFKIHLLGEITAKLKATGEFRIITLYTSLPWPLQV